MVMDFEDGVSLSKMLKQGRRFNERSLWNLLQPIAEGLDRAHRVGVLHRDIKPPNILITEDNRPVLIDFGSARFEAAEATSTKVTFHTPPYAAIEQYVKTYEQGPWTDIYALAVVMYECITGEKPPEVLERLHAGLGKPLAEGKWPGYSKRFLSAVDAGMTVKPDERPQTMAEWLAMFGRQAEEESDDDEATRFYAKQMHAEDIAPVPPTPDVDRKTPVKTGVPSDPKKASFKGAGQETAVGKKAASEKEAVETARNGGSSGGKNDAVAEKKKPAPTVANEDTPSSAFKKPTPALAAGIAVAVLVLGGGGFMMLRGGGSPPEAVASEPAPDAGFSTAVANASTNESAAIVNALGNAGADAAPGATDQDSGADEALRREAARAAAAEAKLAKAQRAAARAAPAAASRPVPTRSTATAQADTGSSAGVSPAKLSQFYSIVDDARSMARRVMRSRNSENARLAKTYDANLRTLRDSIRGIQSDREADRLIKQANQTRAYVQFLDRQQ
jgi:hypothetical protein